MANERFYTIEPIDVEGTPFTLEGLQATLDKVRDTWGGKEHKPPTVSPALSLGGGAAILAVETGRVMIIRDDAARAIAQVRAKQDNEPDGRTRIYHADIVLTRVEGTRGEEVTRSHIHGTGLMQLMFGAAMWTQDVLGDVPECMSLERCEIRERSIRAQMSRANSQQRVDTLVHFPASTTAPWFEVGTKPGEFYQISLLVHLDAHAATAELDHIPLPRR